MTTAEPTEVEEFAPAKINLALHVTGQRADGYHLLDSLVVFAGVGDRILAMRNSRLSLTVEGPMASALNGDDDNLVLRAARFCGLTGLLTLTKVLPVASGIGGGSADAAATLRALGRLWGRAVPGPSAVAPLGADVPVCLAGQPARMEGIGDLLSPLPALPPVWLVLVNPGLAVPTSAVFQGLKTRNNPPLPSLPSRWPDAAALAGYLRSARNDLEGPALRIAPAVGDVLAGLAALPGCLLARMSGSGATCVGLFAEAGAAERGAGLLSSARPGWWVRAAPVLAGRACAADDGHL